MKIATFRRLIAIPLLTLPALAQRVEPVNSLHRARSTYEASDTDKDGRVTIEEFARQKLTIQKADFEAMDSDKNGAWSKDEFLVYYRRILINSGQRAADDLEAEVARIQAARRAKAASTGPKRPAVTPDAAARLRAAIDDLEKKDAQRQATHADFQRVKDSMLDCAKQLTAQDPTTGAELVARFESAVNALEAKAKAGTYTREDYTALREALIARGRDAAKPISATGPVNAPLTEQQLQTALDAALDDLANKAEARNATRDDYTRVKESYIARARAAAPSTDAAVVAERGTLEQRFISAIDKLEVDAREGRFTRAEFQTIRDTYVARVRAIAGSSATSPAAAPGATPNAAPAATGDLAAMLDAALDDLAKKAEARQATREDFGRVRDAMIARTRAIASKDAAAASKLGTLDELFTKAMDKLEADAREGKYSREEFTALRDNYVGRARAIVAAAGTPAPAAQPENPPAPPPAPLPAATTDGIEKRFDDALADLERKAVARGATPEDYQRVSGLLIARARAAVQTQEGMPVAEGDPRIAALAASLQSAMARLETAAAAGGVTSADFANLRQMLIARAREAVKPPAPEVKPPEVTPAPTRPDPKPAEQKPVDPKAGEARTGETAKPADAPPARTRPTPEQPKPEQPKPAEPPKPTDPPKEGRPVPPPTPPHRD